MHTHAVSPELLKATLVGLEHKRDEIERSIRDVRAALGGIPEKIEKAKRGDPGKVSTESSVRMGEAQSKPAGARKDKEIGTKRAMSAEGRARIAEAARKMWATKRAAAEGARA